MLSTDMLPYADVHEHHSLNINPAKQRRMRRESVTLAALWNNAALVQLRHLE